MSQNERYLEIKRKLFDKFYSDLNPEQRRAVFTVNGPLLILAGAGSGKTTVLCRRIVYIIKYGNAYFSDFVPDSVDEEYLEQLEDVLKREDMNEIENTLSDFTYKPVPPYRILAITFTNKAAGEIKSRLAEAFEDKQMAEDIWAGTFHSICMRILRVNCERVGYRPGFTIYDADDTKKAITNAMKSLDMDEKQLPVKSVISAISKAKDRLLDPKQFEIEAASDYRMSRIANIYSEYQHRLEASNAMDFDDIIMKTVKLLRENPDILDYFRRKFKYVCVDEYQDTNEAQFVLTELLSGGYHNIMVVGDDDQSIYRFRGATIANILNFEKNFSNSTVIKLEQNYRSTSTILNAANGIIAHNTGRHQKSLWTTQNQGEDIVVYKTEDQNTEARYIVDTIYRSVRNGRKYKDFAVLYRTNSQSNSIERAFAKSGIPYRLLGGTRFSDRKEIRDVVAYMQLSSNHSDRERLLRIINEPKRKIGNVTIDAVDRIAYENDTTMFEIIKNASRYTALSRSAKTLEDFAALIERLTAISENASLTDFFDSVLSLTGYRQMIVDMGEEEKDRLDNLDEFKSSIIEYINNSENPTLIGFLEENALVADVDRYDEEADAVVMMTIHSAKGLEFPIVILPGMEDGIFPGMQNILGTDEDMEEERRLAYVALTRAKERIYITHTKNRLLYGQTMANPISRFVEEIPHEHIIESESEGLSRPYHNDSYTSKPQGRVYIHDGKPTGTRLPWQEGSAVKYGYDSRKTPQTANKITVTKPQIARSNDSLEVLEPNTRVRHMTFGEGTILSVRKMGADVLYEVVFDKVGTKKLMATYAKLKKI